MYNIDLPSEFLSIIGNEKIDFAVKPKRYQARSKSLILFFFATFWCVFVSIFVIAFFGPLLTGGEVHFSSNGEPQVASEDNLKPLLLPALIIGLFAVVGIGLMTWALTSMFKKAGYFVGTATRLMHYRNGKLITYDWEQFTGVVEVNLKRGDIEFELRTGRMQSRKNGPDRYVPNKVEISGVDNPQEIELITRKRIKENDPTPPVRIENGSQF